MAKAPFKLAAPPEGSFRYTLALHGDAVPEAVLGSSAFPWTYVGGVPVIHRSSAFMAFADNVACGFADRKTRERYERYVREAKKSYPVARLIPSSYDWSRHFTRAWKPRAYQCAGMDRLYRRAALCGGTILGDDVGLGKTIQAIGACERIREEVGGLIVVVTTISTLSQWRDEIERFAKSKPRVVIADGPDRLLRLKNKRRDWLLMSYETNRLPQFAAAVDAIDPTVVVFDEAFKLANRETQTQVRAKLLADRAKYVFEFNATPIENGVADLFGQLRCIDPNIIGAWDMFNARYIVRSETGREVAVKNLKELRLRVSGVLCRRTARECGAEVPGVLAEVRLCEMGKKQLAAYRHAVGDFVSDSSTGAVARAKLARVRYAAFAEDISDSGSQSCKCDDLMSLLQTELAGERVIVISRYRRVVEFIRERLQMARLPHYVIHGDTKQIDRGDIARRFSSRIGRGRVLLGTEAIQRGMNLQRAGVLVNVDLPWTSSALRQRVGRIARIGQRRSRVLVLNQRAVTKHKTVDDWIESIVIGKRGIVMDYFGDDGVDELGSDRPSVSAVRAFLRACV